jgi:ribonuclease P protein component
VERLRGGAAIQEVFRQGRRLERGCFIAIWRAASGTPGVAFAVSRQAGGAASRNRARRRLREAYRRQEGRIPAGAAVVFVARARALTADFPELMSEMASAIMVLRREVAAATRVTGEGA